jgi:uncharacterized protein (TIGR00266 family)
VHTEIRHNPSFAVARVNLDPNEQIRAESGAMMAHSPGIAVEASTQGGLMKGLKRSFLGGESLFISTFTAPPTGGWIDVANFLVGDVIVAGVLPDQPMFVTKGSWLASSASVELDTKWGGFKNYFGSEGGFLIHATGHGTILLACYGAIDTINLQPGESVTVDTGHVLAYGPTVTFGIRKVATGLIQSMKSGEGFVFDFTGPGWVMTQSRNPSALAAWVRAIAPGQSGGAGNLGSILGS